MRAMRALVSGASLMLLFPFLVGAAPGPGPGSPTPNFALGSPPQVQRVALGEPPTRVRLSSPEAAFPAQSLAWRGPTPIRPIASPYGPPDSGATAEIISRAGEILGAMNNPDRRNELAEQWLQYSKGVIAKEQDFRDQWLDVQRQQLAQMEQAGQLQLEIAQLQMKIEELRAENLRLQQENLAAQQKLAQRAGG